MSSISLSKKRYRRRAFKANKTLVGTCYRSCSRVYTWVALKGERRRQKRMTFRATAVFTTPTTPSSAPWRDVSGFSRACSYPQNIRDTCILWPPSGIARVVLHLLLLLPPHEAQEIGSNVSDLAFLVWTYSFPHFCSKVTLPVKGLRRNSNAYRKFRRMRSNYLHAFGFDFVPIFFSFFFYNLLQPSIL